MEYRWPGRWLLIALIGSLSLSAYAQETIYSTLGASDAYATLGPGYGVFGSSIDIPPADFTDTAAPFTPGANYEFEQIDLALTWGGAPNSDSSVTVSLDSDDDGLPGSVLESWTLSGGLPTYGFSSNTVQTFLATSSIELLAGVQYWIVASPGDSESDVLWNANTVGVDTSIAQNTGSGFVSENFEDEGGLNTPAFDVQGAATPEPGTLSVALISLVALGVVGLRKIKSA